MAPIKHKQGARAREERCEEAARPMAWQANGINDLTTMTTTVTGVTSVACVHCGPCGACTQEHGTARGWQRMFLVARKWGVTSYRVHWALSNWYKDDDLWSWSFPPNVMYLPARRSLAERVQVTHRWPDCHQVNHVTPSIAHLSRLHMSLLHLWSSIFPLVASQTGQTSFLGTTRVSVSHDFCDLLFLASSVEAVWLMLNECSYPAIAMLEQTEEFI